MDAILASLVVLLKGTLFPLIKPYLSAFILGSLTALIAGMATCAEDTSEMLRVKLREAIARAGFSEKEIAYHCGVTKANLSERLSGVRAITFDFIARMPTDVRRWFAVGLVEAEGVPAVIKPAAQLFAIASKESAA